MGANQSNQNGQKQKQLDAKALQRLRLKPLIKKLRQKYSRFSWQSLTQGGTDLINLQQQIRNIYMGIINEKLVQANEGKIKIQQCKIQVSQQILSVQIFILKYVQKQGESKQYTDIVKLFHLEMGKFLVTLTRFLKSFYPRSQNLQAGQLTKQIKQFDYTEQFDFDILKNAGFVFKSTNQFDITNTVKLLLNQIMRELDLKFPEFYQLMNGINKAFKIGRKISENTARYTKLDTGTVEINSTEIARVLIKWMQQLSNPSENITAKNQYKFFKVFPEQANIEFAKCEEQTLKKFINHGNMVDDLKREEDDSTKKSKKRVSKFRKFNMHLMEIFNNVELHQSEVSRQMMQIIKYSAFNSSFIAWMVEEELIKSISQLVEVGQEFQDFRGVLDLVKFKIFDLLRCQIYGDKKTIYEAYQKIKQKELEDKIQIVKVKNRFHTALGDAMIFFKFPDSFLICECQLILSEETKGEDAKKAKNTQTLNHYLYELERSPFGVLGEISNLLTAKSKIVSLNCDSITLIRPDKEKIKKCFKQHEKISDQNKHRQQKSPFVCSSCLKFFKKLSNKIATHYCQKCIVFLCNKCMNVKFQITQDMICEALSTKIYYCHEELKRTKLYRQDPHTFDFAFKQVSPKEIITDFFSIGKMNKVDIIKEGLKNNQLKVSSIINYINQKADYAKIHQAKGVKVNFGIITWRDNQTRFKCYRFQNDENIIQNVFQPVQRYVAHEYMEVYDYDYLIEFKTGGFCIVNEKNRNEDDGFQFTARSLIERGLFLFEGQSKQLMISTLEKLSEQQRKKSLLKYCVVNDELSLIVDISQSIKRSSGQNKIQEYLQVLTKNDHQKKSLKMTEMNITNESLKIIQDHSKWIKNIKSLIISDNNVSEMDVVFMVCKSIEKLNISKNRFSMLRFIVAAPSLVELDASENSIEKIVNFYNIRKIETLNLKSNKIECLTRWVEKKKEEVRSSATIETEIVSCDSIPQPSSPSFIDSLFNICRRPGITQTEFGFSRFPPSSEMIVSALQLKEVKSLKKDENGAYIYLRQMVLANNRIKNMNEFAQGYYPNLTYLDLNDNLIEEVPALDLDKIQEVRLANNCIQKITAFAQVENDSLNTLDFKNNKITTLPKFNFYRLTHVDFSYNTLSSCSHFITGNYFQNLTNLHLSHIKVDTLTKVPTALKVLSLENCQLNDLELATFFDKFSFQKLKELYLTRNQLTKLPNIQNLPRINSIFLEENPIKDTTFVFKQLQKAKQDQQKEQKKKQKDKKKKKKQDQQQKKLKRQRKGLYSNLSHLWVSIDLTDNKQFQAKSEQLKNCLVNTDVICWKYDNVFGAVDTKMKRTFSFLQDDSIFKELIIKRIYLKNIFETEEVINNRFIFSFEFGLYSLEHQWDNIDMNEFIKYDWNELYSLNLSSSGMDDTKWKLIVENAQLFPALNQIVMWDHKITTITDHDLDLFPKLKKFRIFESNVWSNPLTQSTKDALKSYQSKHPDAELKFQDDYTAIARNPKKITQALKNSNSSINSPEKPIQLTSNNDEPSNA